MRIRNGGLIEIVRRAGVIGLAEKHAQTLATQSQRLLIELFSPYRFSSSSPDSTATMRAIPFGIEYTFTFSPIIIVGFTISAHWRFPPGSCYGRAPMCARPSSSGCRSSAAGADAVADELRRSTLMRCLGVEQTYSRTFHRWLLSGG